MTATMGVALLIPFSFGMDLIPSIGLLLGIYCGGMYGGSHFRYPHPRPRHARRSRHPAGRLPHV